MLLVSSLTIPTYAIDDTAKCTSHNFAEMFEIAENADGYIAEDIAHELYEAFQSEPIGFVNAATKLSPTSLANTADLLVYYAGYFNLDEFESNINSFKINHNLTEAEQLVVDAILQAIEKQRSMPIEGSASELPPAPKFSPVFLQTLIDSHIEINNFEDEEFMETLNTVYHADPSTFSSIVGTLPASQIQTIANGIALECAKNNMEVASINGITLTDEQVDTLDTIEKTIESKEVFPKEKTKKPSVKKKFQLQDHPKSRQLELSCIKEISLVGKYQLLM